MNHIVKLSTKSDKDSILIIKNQTTKAIQLKAITKKQKAEEV